MNASMFIKWLKHTGWILILVFSVGVSLAGISGFRVEWNGIWNDSSGGIISVSEKDGFLDILGKDEASIYSCLGIIDGTLVQCFGGGINHIDNLRFLYKTKLTMKENGQKIEEEWEALFAGGKKIEGKNAFQRKPSK